MKKIMVLLFIFVNTLLFLNIIEVFKEEDVSDVMRFPIPTFQEDVVHATVILQNTGNRLLGEESGLNPDDTFPVFEEMTATFKNSMIAFVEYDFINNRYTFYLISTDPIDERFGLVTDTSLTFGLEHEYFYTNRVDVSNGVHFYLLNEDLEVNIHPISHMDALGNFFLVANSEEDLNGMIDKISAEFGDYVLRVERMDSDPLDVEYEINSFLSPTIFITMALIFLLLIMYVHIYSKKIAILKTLGTSLWVVGRKLFLPVLLAVTATVVLTQFILFFVFVGVVNERTVPIIMTLVRVGSYQLVGVIVILLLNYLFLMAIPTYSLIKRANVNRFLMGGNYVLKILVLLIMLPFISAELLMVRENLERINYVDRYLEEDFVTSQFSPSFKPSYSNAEYYHLLYDVIGFDNLYNREKVLSHELLREYHRAHDILNSAGAIFSSTSSILGGAVILSVNENYLLENPIRDMEGNIVSVADSEADIVYLIPEMFKGREENFITDMFHDNYEIRFIENNEYQGFDYSINSSWALDELGNRPFAFAVYRDTAFRYNATIFRNMFFQGDLNEQLRDTIFYNRIEITTIEEEIEVLRAGAVDEIQEGMWIFLPSVAILSLIIIQYTYLYVKVHRKRIHVKKLMGYSPFSVYANLLLEGVMAVVAAVIVAWQANLDFQLLFAVIVLDVLAYLCVIIIDNRKNPLREIAE